MANAFCSRPGWRLADSCWISGSVARCAATFRNDAVQPADGGVRRPVRGAWFRRGPRYTPGVRALAGRRGVMD